MSHNTDVTVLEHVIGTTFVDTALLVLSLTHTSYAMEHDCDSDNERLEFLGDAVLSLVVTHYLFVTFPSHDEGSLSKLRSKIVSKEQCALWAKEIDLGSFLLLGKGEELSKGREKKSNLANAFEALIGALYMDSGYGAVERFLHARLKQNLCDEITDDHKSQLQEAIQKRYKKIPEYTVVKSTGPDHNKMFFVHVLIRGVILGSGQGKSKKEAEQMAAKGALEQIRAEEMNAVVEIKL